MSRDERTIRRALLLVDHGSRLDEANAVLDEAARQARRRGRFDVVATAHMDLAPPTVAEALARCLEAGVEEVVVAPFMLAPGRHSVEDIPRLVREAAPEPGDARIVVAEPLGAASGVVSVLLRRAEAASEASARDGRRGRSHRRLFRAEDCVLVVVDIQEGLLPHIINHDEVLAASRYLIRAARELSVPIFLTEQYPKGLGRTDPAILEALPDDLEPIEKITFSSLGEEGLSAALPSDRRSLVLCGIETHICVMQTALEALENGWRVAVARDAAGSRNTSDRQAALARMARSGATVATAEMLVYEWLERAGTAQFKALLPLLKEGPLGAVVF